jgi:hypothetical protein
MAVQPMSGWSLRLPEPLMRELHNHLFPGDHDEHGAVIGASVVTTPRGTRLLARRLLLAEDGVDYVPGHRGYRMLTASFVRRCALACAREGLAYLPIHCHGGIDRVGFSAPDLASHARGYPAVLDILNGPPAVALVFAEHAVAGDVWLPDRSQLTLDHLDVVGRIADRLYPQPPLPPLKADPSYDRQARLFGDRGQEILAGQKVGIIGLGGAGSLINEYLARLGVGHIVAVDDDRVDLTNLPRLVGARRLDALAWLTNTHIPGSLRRLAERHATRKVRLARRVARQANREIRYEAIAKDVTDPCVIDKLIDCDYIFLAADSMQARLVANALVHQYLIPGVQVGAKVDVNEKTGAVQDVFSVVRHLVPGESCLWCNQLINPARLAEEAAAPEQRRAQRYVPEVHAPSVVTLNAVACSHAVNDYLFSTVGLARDVPLRWRKIRPTTDQVIGQVPRRDPICPECAGRLGAGSTKRLPVRTAA